MFVHVAVTNISSLPYFKAYLSATKWQPLNLCCDVGEDLKDHKKKLGTSSPGPRGLQQAAAQYQDFNKLCQNHTPVRFLQSLFFFLLTKVTILSTPVFHGPCFPAWQESPGHRAGFHHFSHVIIIFPANEAISSIWCPVLHSTKGIVAWREDHKKSGKLMNVVALRPGFEGRSVDVTGWWKERLRTRFYHPFHK